MKIPSAQTRYDMETAAELRAAGATWATIGLTIGRPFTVVERWTRYYAEDWERLIREAEERLARETSPESRNELRAVLRHHSRRVRSAAANRLVKRRLEQKASEPPPGPPAHLIDLWAHLQTISDEEFEEEIADFIDRKRSVAGEQSGEQENTPA